MIRAGKMKNFQKYCIANLKITQTMTSTRIRIKKQKKKREEERNDSKSQKCSEQIIDLLDKFKKGKK